MLKLCLILSLLIVCTISGKHCEGKQCQDGELPSITKITLSVDENVRRVFWYYLRSSHLIYQLTVETPSSYLFFFIFRNGLGTFLAISEWTKADRKSDIVNFVHLGEGYQKDIQTPFSPILIRPYFISLRLAEGEYLVEVNDEGKFVAKGQILEKEEQIKELKILNQKQKAQEIKDYLLKQYWFYLRDSNQVHSSSILTSTRVYTVSTYVNIGGTFLAIASINDKNHVHLNTLTRLGRGSAESEELKPIEISPAVIEFK